MQDNMLQGVSKLSETLQALPAVLQVIGYTATKGPADPNRPAGLFNTMVKTIAGYSCRGVLWYHGESDADKAENYADLCSAVIRCWRDSWQEELPYLLVQLAPYEKSQLGSGEKFPVIREQQESVSKNTPGTYLVSIMDCGEKNDIHPKRKRPVGERLALLARGRIYGEPLLCDPPELSSASFNKDAITLRFADAGEGLRLEGPLFSALKIKVGGKAVSGFSVQIDNDSIEIRSGEFKARAHVEVFFAWSGYCEVNLFNSAGLPAKPFRIAGEIPS
jgi:sialate O-acetylesterase